MHINIQRLWDDLLFTAQFGKVKETGITRLTFDQNDKKIRQWFTTICHNLGGAVRTDRAGNQFARFFSSNDQQPTILIGSHLDTQPNGGRFDGILGVLAGIEVIRTFIEKQHTPKHAIEIINWSNEEGARFSPPMMGSAYACGHLDLYSVLESKDKEGYLLRDISEGFRSDSDVLTKIKPSCYLELHIEQGPVLEKENINIGVVTSITGISWFSIRFFGKARHAGTTPLNYRNDSLIKSAKFIIEFQKYLIDNSDNIIGTIGKIENFPNTPNTVPEETIIYIDIRSANEENLDNIDDIIKEILHANLKMDKSDFELKKNSNIAPTNFSPLLIRAIDKSIHQIGLTSRHIVSGAGHDALQLAKLFPTGMIFVPCEDGISHNINENIEKDYAENGANSLLKTILNLDKILID